MKLEIVKMYNDRSERVDWSTDPTEMGAPKKWIKTLLGLKKSDKVSSRRQRGENSSGSTGKMWQPRRHSMGIDNNIFDHELNRNVDIEFEDADLQSVQYLASSPSTSVHVHNEYEFQWSVGEKGMAIDDKHTKFLSASDSVGSPSTSLQVQSAAQEDKGDEWEAIYANSLSISDPTSPQSTSLQMQNAAEPQQSKEEELADIDAEDPNFQSIPDPTTAPSTSLRLPLATHLARDLREERAAMRIQIAVRGLLLQNKARLQQRMSEEAAAIRIQAAFRGFLARRALHRLKGMGRIQALVRGHAVRRQAAITLHCMQALVKVQARSRARNARLALENEATQQKLQQLEQEAQVKKPEERWCDMAGSADEIQAKLLKRKEAAALREKAKAYAKARQWQAGSRQQVTFAGFDVDKSNWGWNWLERWMAVRPWENRISDTSFREGMKILEKEAGGAKNAPKIRLSTEKKSISSAGKGRSGPPYLNLNISNAKNAADGNTPSPNKSALTPTKIASTRRTSNSLPKESATSSPNLSSRSVSNPKERSNLSNVQVNKRLSLPAGVAPMAQTSRQLSGTTAKSSPTTPKSLNARTKSNKSDAKTTKLVRHVSH